MKKVLFMLLLVMLLPVSVHAISISNATLTGPNSITEGDYEVYKYTMNFKDIHPGSNKGIMIVILELEYDHDVFVVTGINTDHFNSTLYGDEKETYIYSEVIRSDNSNMCAYGNLYCGSQYEARISLFAEKTDKKSAAFKVKTSGILYLDITDFNKNYTIDDLVEVKYEKEQSKTITIYDTDKKVTTPKAVTIKKEKPKTTISNVTTTKKSNSNKSSNKTSNKNVSNSNIVSNSKVDMKDYYLESLEVVGFDINFKPNETFYIIETKDDINSLEINYKAYSSKATVEVTGNDNLKENNNKVVINVTSKSGTKNPYIIQVKKIVKEENLDDYYVLGPYKVKKDYVNYGGIGLGIIIVLIIIKVIITKLSNRKMDKYLDKL